MMQDKFVVLGVTGSIAAYKAADLASKLVQAHAKVDVIMTREAREFITPLTFRSLTHRPVVTDLFDLNSELSIEHVALAERADIVVVAPCTANTIAKITGGVSDDPLTTTILATRAPVLIAPAMDGNMYQNPATQDNLERLKSRGIAIVGPAEGRLASGLIGKGRMVEPAALLEHIKMVLGRKGDLAGLRVVVSAGGTQEPIDPVRVITNRSSGKMGFSIAEAARDRGATVTLITAPSSLPNPVGVHVVRVNRAVEMKDAVSEAVQQADTLIMAAAVADYQPVDTSAQKIKKTSQDLSISLVKTPDILAEVRGSFVKVGFAAESENLIENAKSKLISKGLDLIVANDITASDSGFGTDTNRVVFIRRDGEPEQLPLMLKYDVAHQILNRVAELVTARRNENSFQKS